MAPTDTLRQAATVMAGSKLTHYPVVDADGKFVGLVTIEDLLLGRSQEARREGERERVLRLRWPFGKKQMEGGA
jgi:CIC family chloride channel protein